MKKKIFIVIATISSIFSIVSFVFIKKPEFLDKLFPQKNSVDSSVVFFDFGGQIFEKMQENKVLGKGPGGCISTESCAGYCTIKENQSECLTFAKEAQLFTDEKMKEMEIVLKQIPPELQNCLKSIMSISMEKVKADGQFDMQALLESCLTKGAKFPNGKTLDKETFEKMQEYYGTTLSKEDREMLQKLIEENGGVPAFTPVHSVKKNLTMDEIEKMNEQRQLEINKIPPEELEAARKANEDAVNNPQNYQGGSNGGMGL